MGKNNSKSHPNEDKKRIKLSFSSLIYVCSTYLFSYTDIDYVFLPLFTNTMHKRYKNAYMTCTFYRINKVSKMQIHIKGNCLVKFLLL
jgi:hypothetical protein